MHGTIEYFTVAVFGEWMIVGAILICLPSIGVLLRRNYFPLNRRPRITVNIRVIGAFAMAYNTLSRGFGLPCFLVVSFCYVWSRSCFYYLPTFFIIFEKICRHIYSLLFLVYCRMVCWLDLLF